MGTVVRVSRPKESAAHEVSFAASLARPFGRHRTENTCQHDFMLLLSFFVSVVGSSLAYLIMNPTLTM